MPKTVLKLPQLSVVINTKNSARTLAQTIESVKAHVAEVIVVDMKSTDDTVQLAKKLGATVFTYKEDVGYVEPARNFAISKSPTEWVLLLDSDETMPLTAWPAIAKAIEVADVPVAGYFLARQNWIFGAWVKSAGWWPDYNLRLFRREAVVWPETIHAVPFITGTTEQFPAKEELSIIHQNYPNVEDFLERLNRYTTKEITPHAQRDVSGASLVNVVAAEWLRRLFADKGIEGGAHGVALSLLQCFYQLSTELKFWQVKGFPESESPVAAAESTIRSIQQFQRDLNYWIADYQVQRTTGFRQWVWRMRRKFSI